MVTLLDTTHNTYWGCKNPQMQIATMVLELALSTVLLRELHLVVEAFNVDQLSPQPQGDANAI